MSDGASRTRIGPIDEPGPQRLPVSADGLPQGVVTFVMTDIEASTRTWSRHGDVMEKALPHHDRVLSDSIARHGGYVLKHRNYGDSFFAVFDRASDAVGACLDVQQALQASSWDEGVELRVRIGIHSGEATYRDGDYFGEVVNRCSRVRDAAHGGQVLVTTATHSLCDGRVESDAGFRSLGPQLLEGIDRRVEVFQLTHPELRAEFPPLRTSENLPNNLPRALNSFVGRTAELDFIHALLGKSRLVTLVGPGGVGKTRLAIEYGRQHLSSFTAGVWLVQLDGVGRDEVVQDALVDAMAAREYIQSSSIRSVVNAIGADPALILLDNCEHVREGGLRLVRALLESCPNVSVLATSREPFGVHWEHQFYVPVLDLPNITEDRYSIEQLEKIDAVRLLIERARAFDSHFRITERNQDAVVRLVRRLDGVPLALELVAPLVPTLSVERILSRLDRFPLRDLATQDPTVEDRHRSVRLMVEWSYELLEERERLFFLRLSVFPDTFDLEAAEQICSGGAIEPDDALGLLASMVRKSLVAKVGEREELRYRQLWAIRQFAREEHEDAEDRAELWDRHADYYAELALASQRGLLAEGTDVWNARIEPDLVNHRQSIDTLLARGDVERAMLASSALWRFWWSVSRFTEGRGEIDRCIEAAGEDAPPSAALAHALHGSGTLATYQGELDTAVARLERALVIWRSLGDEDGILRSSSNIASVWLELGKVEAALDAWEEGLAVAERKGDERSAAVVRFNLALVYRRVGRFEEAIGAARTSRAYFATHGDSNGASRCAMAESVSLVRTGRAEEAIALLEEALHYYASIGDEVLAAEVLIQIGHARMARNDLEQADRAFAEALETLRQHEANDHRARCLQHYAQAKMELGDLDEARALMVESATVVEALEDRREHERDHYLVMAELTRREGAWETSRSMLAKALPDLQSLHNRPALPEALTILAALRLAENDPEGAAFVLSLAERTRRELEMEDPLHITRRASAMEVEVRDALGEEARLSIETRVDQMAWADAAAEVDAIIAGHG